MAPLPGLAGRMAQRRMGRGQQCRYTDYPVQILEAKEIGILCHRPWGANEYYHVETLLLFSCSVMSDSQQPHGLQPTRLLHPWIFQARVLEWGAIAFSGGGGVQRLVSARNSSQAHGSRNPSLPTPLGHELLGARALWKAHLHSIDRLRCHKS